MLNLEGLLGYLFGLLQYFIERDLYLVFRSYFSPDLVTKNNRGGWTSSHLLAMLLKKLIKSTCENKIIKGPGNLI